MKIIIGVSFRQAERCIFDPGDEQIERGST